MTDPAKLAQSLGGVKSQQGIMRADIRAVDKQDRATELKVNMCFLSNVIFYGMLFFKYLAG